MYKAIVVLSLLVITIGCKKAEEVIPKNESPKVVADIFVGHYTVSDTIEKSPSGTKYILTHGGSIYKKDSNIISINFLSGGCPFAYALVTETNIMLTDSVFCKEDKIPEQFSASRSGDTIKYDYYVSSLQTNFKVRGFAVKLP